MAEILFLCHRLPFPPNKGDKIRSWHILDHLCRSHSVHLGCFIDDPADAAHLPMLRERCRSVAAFPLSRHRKLSSAARGLIGGHALTLACYDDPRLWRWVRRVATERRLDLTFAFSGAMAPYARAANATRTVLDLVDVDSLKWAAYARQVAWPASWVYAREAAKLLAFERAAAAAFDATVLVSAAESQSLRELAPELADRVSCIENGVDHAYFRPAPYPTPYAAGTRPIVFTGMMDYRPNVDAMGWFVADVFPALRRRYAGAELHIVGANPAAEIRRLARVSQVHVTGRVADVRPYLGHAEVVVAPLRIARGVQNKVLEAMAMGRPVVASPEALEGIRATPDRDVLVAAGATATAVAIGDVFDGRHSTLGGQARAAMVRGYSWPHMLAPLDALLAGRVAVFEPAPALAS